MVLEHRVSFRIDELIDKKSLALRWPYATEPEIHDLYSAGKLNVYSHLKGPIGDVVFCTPSSIGFWDGEYSFGYLDYYVLSEVEACEKEYPDFLGNVTLGSSGLLQTATPKAPDTECLHPGLVTLSADEVIRRLKITPFEMAGILNGRNFYDENGNYIGNERLVTVDEEDFQEHQNSGSCEKFFKVKGLEKVKIYQRDFEQYCEEWGIQKQTQAEAVDTSGLEAQLAEAHAKVTDLQAQLAELKETSAKLAKTTRAQAGAIGKSKKDLESWKVALPMAAKATAAVIAAGKDLRSREELRAICVGCGVTFSGVQLEAWRSGLPEGYFDKDDRSTPSGDPPSTV